MDRNNDQITSEQLYSLLVGLIIGIGILSLPRALAEKAGSDSLIVLVLGSLLFMALALIIVKLIERFPQSTIIEMGNSLLVKPIGYILGFGYFIYTLLLIALEVRAFGEITKSFLLLSTPIEIIMLTFLLAAVYAVRSGIETVTRLAVIILPLSFIPTLLIILIALPQCDFTYFLPVLKKSPKELLEAVKEVGFSFLGFEFIVFLNFFVKDYKNIKKVSLWSIATVAFIYFIVVAITIARFGLKETQTLIWPVVTIFKTIDIPGTIFENVESVIMTTWLLSIFMTVCITYLGATFLLSRIIKSREQNYLVMPLLPIVYTMTLIPENIVHTYDFLSIYSDVFGTVFAGVIPILLFVISIFKKNKKGIKKNV